MYFNFFEMINCVFNSKDDPIAISINLENSFSEDRLAPSATLEAIDTDDLLIWDIRPNFSSPGKPFVIL